MAMMQPIATQKLLIIVGVTGVGKTTTVNALADAGLQFKLLPNRRALTDQLIIPEVQADLGVTAAPITDRAQRFAYTRHYRSKYAGGMADALGQLTVEPADNWLLFDGLRGENEVAHAVNALPLAHFLVLDAPHAVRVQRLLGRNDAFDQITTATDKQHDGASLDQLVTGVTALFSPAEQAELRHLIDTGAVSADEMAAKLSIVKKEAENYDPTAAIITLQQTAPERTIVIDTTQSSPEKIAQIVLRRLC